MKKPNLLIIQRISLSHSNLRSRSIGARFVPLLEFMERNNMLKWDEALETDVTYSTLKKYNAILLNKHTSLKGLEIIKIAKDIGVKIVYDLDDWILDLPSYSVTNLENDTLSNIVEMIAMCDVVTVSNTLLKSKVSSIRNDAKIIKNGFDHESIPIKINEYEESLEPKILFSNTDGIKLVKYKSEFINQIIEFLEINTNVTLEFWGDYFPELSRIPRIIERGFNPNKEYKKALKDEGYWFAIVPLGGEEDPDTLFFNSCKSCIKYIDYGSLGIPGIYSDTPVYSEAIQSGSNGIIVKNEGVNWYNAMDMLFQNTLLRDEIRRNAYYDCVSNYGLDKVSKYFLDCIFN